jgi:hypothetical protein
LVPGDFCTDSTTAARPASAAVPRRVAAPRRTSATWPMVIGWPSRCAITVPATSSTERTRPVWRIGNSSPSTSASWPAPAVVCARRAASATSASDRPNWRSGSCRTSTWYSASSPPRATTCAVPGTASSWLRRSNSA